MVFRTAATFQNNHPTKFATLFQLPNVKVMIYRRSNILSHEAGEAGEGEGEAIQFKSQVFFFPTILREGMGASLLREVCVS